MRRGVKEGGGNAGCGEGVKEGGSNPKCGDGGG